MIVCIGFAGFEGDLAIRHGSMPGFTLTDGINACFDTLLV